MYARWLAAQGHQVHLLELAGAQVDYAREHMMAAGTIGGGEERSRMTVEKLIDAFSIDNDRMLL